MVCHEIQAFHNLLIPRYRVEVDDEGGEPKAHPDPDDLEEAHVSTQALGWWRRISTDETGHEQGSK